MEEALIEWRSVFDEASYNIWQNSPPKFALVQVIFHNLIKQLQSLQKEFSQNCTQKFNMSESFVNMLKDNCTVKMDAQDLQSTTESVKDNRVKVHRDNLQQHASISDIDSSDVFDDNSILSPSDMNISDNIFNRNLLNTKSPTPDRKDPAHSIIISPIINRRKSMKKKKLAYPELNTSEKCTPQESISCAYSQTSLINFSKNEIPTKNRSYKFSDGKLNTTRKSLEITTPELESTQSNEILRPSYRGLSKIRKRLHDLKSFSPTKEQFANLKKEEWESAEVVTEASPDTNKSVDATILLSCPIKITEDSDLNESFLKPPKVNATKPMFLSKWQQRKLQEEDLGEQNCSKCGNFGGFKDLSPTMCGTNGFKCQKHRKKYLRPNTPSAIWNLNFPDDNE